jgi:hypothetical protein
MNRRALILRGLTYYWRTNLAVVLGVATAVAVLAGALVVGDSVRGSLRDLVLERLGETDYVIVSGGFFREQLESDLRTQSAFETSFDDICPILMTQGFVSAQSGDGSAGNVRVYGIDDRFWKFHHVGSVTGPSGRDALISPALANELRAEAGASILVRVQRPSDAPLESLHSRKEDLGRTLRVTVREILPREELGEFSLDAQQGEVRAVFLPMALLKRELEVGNRVNALLVSEKQEGGAARLQQLLQSEVELEDLGLKLRPVSTRNEIMLEADAGLLDDVKATVALDAARQLGLEARLVLTYLANTLSAGGREIPYSLVTAADLPAMPFAGKRPIVLTDWAARDLQSTVGDALTLEYYVWEEPGRLATRTAEFQVSGIVPLTAGDRDLAPVYPGITDSAAVSDWDPPFPINLRKVRVIDEEYWEKHRTTPKAYIPLALGQELWRSRYGALTSIRLAASGGQLDELQPSYAQLLRRKLDPLAMGIAVRNVRTESLQASRGATDFGEYFVYFSFFLVVSALMLAALFFK